ncbi:unnamed protein product [Ambrosiozyma monospora]|uniref:Unnamed protein product n=1 Tax=Ambrosiozyma monospora TaxID=43982 RepID=A0ACB5U9U7_AMBMO|nr:unnamed protein product [Ambrosiozyma monospora]
MRQTGGDSSGGELSRSQQSNKKQKSQQSHRKPKLKSLRSSLSTLFKNDLIYANAIKANKVNNQFVTSAQALAPLLSRDSFLCLEGGESLGLYYPWRDLYNKNRERCDSFSVISTGGLGDGEINDEKPSTTTVDGIDPNGVDHELNVYLKSKGAYDKPSLIEQKRLVGLYLKHSYPFYPI